MKKIVYLFLIIFTLAFLASCNHKKVYNISVYNDVTFIINKNYILKNVKDLETLENVDFSQISSFPLKHDTKLQFYNRLKNTFPNSVSIKNDFYLRIVNLNTNFKTNENNYRFFYFKKENVNLFEAKILLNYKIENEKEYNTNFDIILENLRDNKKYLYHYEVEND